MHVDFTNKNGDQYLDKYGVTVTHAAVTMLNVTELFIVCRKNAQVYTVMWIVCAFFETYEHDFHV